MRRRTLSSALLGMWVAHCTNISQPITDSIHQPTLAHINRYATISVKFHCRKRKAFLSPEHEAKLGNDGFHGYRLEEENERVMRNLVLQEWAAR